uniref:FZ domain-containing protein n=1 Tax=Romanomermis culicivorax TaxID=13658 RepID=A0A915I7Z9_ROMCU
MLTGIKDANFDPTLRIVASKCLAEYWVQRLAAIIFFVTSIIASELLQEDLSNVVPEESQDSTTYCDLLNTKCQGLYDSTIKECPAEAAYLMCKSLQDAFVNIFPEILENCRVPCAVRAGDADDLHGNGDDGSSDTGVGRIAPNYHQIATEQSKQMENKSLGTNRQHRI